MHIVYFLIFGWKINIFDRYIIMKPITYHGKLIAILMENIFLIIIQEINIPLICFEFKWNTQRYNFSFSRSSRLSRWVWQYKIYCHQSTFENIPESIAAVQFIAYKTLSRIYVSPISCLAFLLITSLFRSVIFWNKPITYFLNDMDIF